MQRNETMVKVQENYTKSNRNQRISGRTRVSQLGRHLFSTLVISSGTRYCQRKFKQKRLKESKRYKANNQNKKKNKIHYKVLDKENKKVEKLK